MGQVHCRICEIGILKKEQAYYYLSAAEVTRMIWVNYMQRFTNN